MRKNESAALEKLSTLADFLYTADGRYPTVTNDDIIEALLSDTRAIASGQKARFVDELVTLLADEKGIVPSE